MSGFGNPQQPPSKASSDSGFSDNLKVDQGSKLAEGSKQHIDDPKKKKASWAWADQKWLLAVLGIVSVFVSAIGMGVYMQMSKKAPAVLVMSPPPPTPIRPYRYAPPPPPIFVLDFMKRLPPPDNNFPNITAQNNLSPSDWYTADWDQNLITSPVIFSFLRALHAHATKLRLNPPATLRTFTPPLSNGTMLAYFRTNEYRFPRLLQGIRVYLLGNQKLTEKQLPRGLTSLILKEATEAASLQSIKVWLLGLNKAHKDMEAKLQGPNLKAIQSQAQTILANLLQKNGEVMPTNTTPLGTRTRLVEILGDNLVPRAPTFQFFSKVEIPLVFHVLLYNDGNFSHPPSAYWGRQDSTYRRIVQNLNAKFSKSFTRISFEIKEVRVDPIMYPYLMFPNYTAWQACASSGPDCIRPIAEKYNVDPTTTINIFTVGTISKQSNADCKNCSLGYAWLPPYPETRAGNVTTAAVLPAPGSPPTRNLTSTEIVASQHVYLNWDVVDTTLMNHEGMWDWGSSIAAFYVARHLGLDQVAAGCGTTPARGAPGKTAPDAFGWYFKSDIYCSKLLTALSSTQMDTLLKLPVLTSLPGTCAAKAPEALHNIFDVMTLGPPPCSFWFSPRSTYMLQALTYSARPTMYYQQVDYQTDAIEP